MGFSPFQPLSIEPETTFDPSVAPSRYSVVALGRRPFPDKDHEQTSALRWYCVHTKPAREHLAAAHLQENLELPTYFPRLRREKIIRRVRQTVIQPLFPRYLFCRFDAAQHFRMVRHATDVLDVVSFGGRPAVVDDQTVRDLQAVAAPFLDVPLDTAGFRAGDEVAIKHGPMQGLRAVVLHADSDRERVALLLSCLEYQAQVMISSAHLERL